MRGDDLVPLLIPPPQQGLGFRQGVILSWDPATAHNTVQVAGTIMTDLPILNTNEAVLLGPGSVVAVITYGSSWFILGRVTIPGTPEAATALQLVSSRMMSAGVVGQGSRASSVFGDLTGTDVGPAVDATISTSGKALVIVGATLSTGGATYSGGLMGFHVSGATTRAASVAESLEFSMSAESFSFSGSRSLLVEGLNAGQTTFTATYASVVNGQAFTASNRNIIVFAL